MKKRRLFPYLLALYCLLSYGSSYAQVYGDTFSAQYFQNKMLSNPAWVGDRMGGYSVWLNYKTLNSNNDGRPVLGALSIDLPVFTHSAFGIYFKEDKSGNFYNRSAQLMYSYYLPFSADQSKWLRLGFSGGYGIQRINIGENTTITDLASKVALYNSRPGQFKTSIGLVFRYNNTEVGLASPEIPNSKVVYDRCVFMSSIGHTLESKYISVSGLSFYRYYESKSHLLDLGMQMEVLKRLFFSTIFNTSSKGATFGAGYSQNKIFVLSFSYSMNLDPTLSNFGGAYEFGVKVSPTKIYSSIRGFYEEPMEEEDYGTPIVPTVASEEDE